MHVIKMIVLSFENVYGLPVKSYEVRTEENAVDIQIHKGTQSDLKRHTDLLESA